MARYSIYGVPPEPVATSPTPVSDTAGLPTIGQTVTAKGYQQITSLSTAAALTIPAGSKRAIIQTETKSVRWRDDGTDPSATVGWLLQPGDTLEYDGDDLTKIKFIETAASAKVNVAYYT